MGPKILPQKLLASHSGLPLQLLLSWVSLEVCWSSFSTKALLSQFLSPESEKLHSSHSAVGSDEVALYAGCPNSHILPSQKRFQVSADLDLPLSWHEALIWTVLSFSLLLAGLPGLAVLHVVPHLRDQAVEVS